MGLSPLPPRTRRRFTLTARPLPRPKADTQTGGRLSRASRRVQAACQMESRSWGNLTRRAGATSPPAIRQIIARPGSPVLPLAKRGLSGEMKGTPPERSHVPTAVHGLASSIANQAAAARCRGNVPVGSLSFGAPASTFHSAARTLLLLSAKRPGTVPFTPASSQEIPVACLSSGNRPTPSNQGV